ncbi:MAG: hypothetical protein FWG93_03350 [Oscillospiraceae bacterium]|nr:hypothetical protein [Oscillospiraceae bacterium]
MSLKTETKYFDILDAAMRKREVVSIYTKERGIVTGTPHNVDEYDADPERLGYVVMLSKHYADTVFLDEIVSIKPVAEIMREAI